MSGLRKLEKEYREIVEKDLQAHAVCAEKIRDYIKNSTAQYHGRCVRTLYIPKLFTLDEVE